MEAGGAHSSGIECVPEVAAATRPMVVLARCPRAERAPDSRAGGVEALVLIRLAIHDDGLVTRKGANTRYYDSVRMGGAGCGLHLMAFSM